jgi:mono/diheme cytochrome c family protein
VVPAKPAPEKVDLGRALVQKDGGFSCVQCHAVNDTPALAPFEAPAPNFALTRERLRDEFYLRWMFNPQHYQPGTRMPQFADADAKTALKDKLDGDARAQFEAVWAYIQSLGR